MNSTVATGTVAKNGYPVGGPRNTTVAVTQEPNPNRLRVKVTTDVPTFFLGLIGMDDVRMTREAVAEYVAPVPMGSPQNKLGNDPDAVDPGTQLWVNISGPQTAKQQGDQYQSKVCGGSPREYGCTGTTNDQYETAGYLYAMDVTSKGTGQTLVSRMVDCARSRSSGEPTSKVALTNWAPVVVVGSPVVASTWSAEGVVTSTKSWLGGVRSRV